MDQGNNNQTSPPTPGPGAAYLPFGPQPPQAGLSYQQPSAPQMPAASGYVAVPAQNLVQPNIPAQQFSPQVSGYTQNIPPTQTGYGTSQPVVTNLKSNPNSTQNTLQIAEIRDGMVIMNDGSFRGVIMVKSINFDLMSPDEKEAVEFSYQGFLNSLYFDIQIFIRTQKVDLRPYIERLDKIRQEQDNMLLALLMEDYIAYIDNVSVQTNIMDKKFYVVIPYYPVMNTQKALVQSKNFFSGLAGLFNTKEQHIVINETDLNKAKDELRNRVQSVLGGLQQCGIQGLPLDTQELIELYYDSYNPDTATRQQLKNFNDLTAPIVTKGQGSAPQPNLDRELR